MKQILLTKEFIEDKLIRPDKNLNTRAFHLYTIDGINPINKYDITWTLHNIKEPPVCKKCGKETKFKSY